MLFYCLISLNADCRVRIADSGGEILDCSPKCIFISDRATDKAEEKLSRCRRAIVKQISVILVYFVIFYQAMCAYNYVFHSGQWEYPKVDLILGY